MRRTRFAIIGVVAALAVGVVGVGAAMSSGDNNEQPITGVELEKATEAAISHMGGGTVSDTEVGDEESYYEVEVTLDDGSQVDVQLDRDFSVVGTEDDGTGQEDTD